MVRKLLSLLLSAILLLTGFSGCFAEQDDFDRNELEIYIPTEPIVTEDRFIRVSAEYLPDANLSRYTATLMNAPTFVNGSPVTAKDLLFSLYVYLDPGYPQFLYMRYLPIAGLESYLLQASEERLSAAAETMTAIAAAGKDHVFSADDPWTDALQTAYWNLHDEYVAACELEFIHCADAIVDYCAQNMLAFDSRGAFGRAPAEIAEDEGLHIAYAMVQWGYATADGNLLTGKRSGAVWNLDETQPSLEDFVNELSIAYEGDLAACWAVETTGSYTPMLPDVEQQFLEIYLGNEKDSITSVSGIRMIDDTTIEIDLVGVNIREAGTLFGMPVLSLAACGDAEQWAPESGLYGHAFGQIPDFKNPEGPILLEVPSENIF